MATKIYLPYQIKDMTPQEIRAAYTQQRAVANKRIARLEKAGLGTGKQKAFPTLRGMSDNEASAALLKVSRWNRDPRHTVKGERKWIAYNLKILHEDFKLNWVHDENFYEFTDFMDDLRLKYSAQVFDSGDASEIFNYAQEVGISGKELSANFEDYSEIFNNAQRIGISPKVIKDRFSFFQEHSEALRRMRPARSKWGTTFEGLRNKIRKLER